jgi:imidazolonepropionase-like amidohydrolase
MRIRAVLCSAALATLLLSAAPASQSAAKVFTGMRLIDGTGRPPVENATIVVQNGRIVAAGPASAVRAPAGAERIPLDGTFVIPGLVNSHAHVGDVARDLAAYAKYGVTTVFSLGNDNNAADVIAARDAQSTPTLTRARVFTAGPVLAPKSVDEAKALVAKNAAMKVDIIKIRVDDVLGTEVKMTPDLYRAVIAEAHARGMRAAVHMFYLDDAKGVLDAGADFLAHSVRDADVDSAFVAKLKARNVCLVPTLAREVASFVYESTPSFVTDPLFTKYADPQMVKRAIDPARQAQMRASPATERYKQTLVVASRNLKTLADAGARLSMGTDTGSLGRFPGYFEWMELDLMAKAGLHPAQVLAAATQDAAACVGRAGDLGTLEPNKWADFLVLGADPLADINNVRTLSDVYIAGNRVSR